MGSDERNKVLSKEHPATSDLCAWNDAQSSTTAKLLRVQPEKCGGLSKVKTFRIHRRRAWSLVQIRQ